MFIVVQYSDSSEILWSCFFDVVVQSFEVYLYSIGGALSYASNEGPSCSK